MRLHARDHLRRSWRLREIAEGFAVEDVWALEARGRPEDFERLVAEVWASLDREPHGIGRVLMGARRGLGRWLGWDRPGAGLGARVTSLREALPPELVDSTLPGRTAAGVPLTPVYQLQDEWVAELANATVHALLHLGWVPEGDGYRGEMTVLVQPNGLGGRLYMAAIRPFRRLIYPRWIRRIESAWPAGSDLH